MKFSIAWMALLTMGLTWALTSCGAPQSQQTSPANPPTTQETNMNTQTATFAAGCFWGVQQTFEKIPGVLQTRAGYTGGNLANPTYEDVCTDETGHAEAVEMTFDPAKVTYQQLLTVFFENHDPTTVDRQGPDVGNQYRSEIFYHSPEQKAQAEAEIARRNASGDYVAPIATKVEQAEKFYAAEDYHQFYFDKHGYKFSCHTGNGKKATAAR